MKSSVLSLIFAAVLALSGAPPALAADATSYTPPGVPQYPHIPMGGSQVQNAGSYGLSSGGHITSNGGPGASVVVGSASGMNYALNTAWTDGAVSTGWIQDYNNPGYYLDPNGTSNVNRMLVNFAPVAAQDAANKAYVDAKAAGTASLGASGYQVLPSGLIIQWGGGSVAVPVTFPTPFPTTCFAVIPTYINTPDMITLSVKDVTRLGFNTVGWGASIYWVAYGR